MSYGLIHFAHRILDRVDARPFPYFEGTAPETAARDEMCSRSDRCRRFCGSDHPWLAKYAVIDRLVSANRERLLGYRRGSGDKLGGAGDRDFDWGRAREHLCDGRR